MFFSGFKGFCGVVAVSDNNFIDFLIGRDFGGNDRTVVAPSLGYRNDIN